MGKIINNGKLLSSTIAKDISIIPNDNITSTNVQDAIIENAGKIKTLQENSGSGGGGGSSVQTNITEDAEYRILLSGSADDETKEDGINKSGGLRFNPSKNSLASGSDTTASGENSHTEGYKTTASNTAAHAEGNNTCAFGGGSHAEGCYTCATGDGSHAEGFYTTDTGDNGSTIYKGNIASGKGSHAEGIYTVASGFADHAEGYCTTASSYYTHAEGLYTIASNQAAHAEGISTNASGEHSHAEGHNTTTSGYYTHAEGEGTFATAIASHAEGSYTTASYSYTHTEGCRTLATSQAAHSEGYYTNASGYYSHAEGDHTTASETASHAEGGNTNAHGYYSHAEGQYTTASNFGSHAEGQYTIACGNSSHAEGNRTNASNYASHAGGHFSATMTTGGDSNNTTGTAFVIGNGTSTTCLSNAFSIQYDGTVAAQSTITASTAADYAEFFEWEDGNPDNEDRVGKFVTLKGDKILIASDPEDYILGIVSGRPFVLGNGDCDVWNGMYLRDEFNRYIKEDAPKMELDEETHEYKEVLDEDGNPVYQGTRFKLNPDYDQSKQYIRRSERKEWAPIGMLGVLSVYQDGTCEIDGYARCNKDGIATACKRTDSGSYRVISKISDKIVKVVFVIR